MNKLLNILLLLLALSWVSCSSSGNDDPNPTPNGGEGNQNLQTVKYTSTKEDFFNPERRMYTMVESNLTTPLSVSRLNTAKNAKESLVQIVYYLKDRRNQALSAADLNKITTDLATVRQVGLKAILRFAYTSAATEPDAPLNIIEQH